MPAYESWLRAACKNASIPGYLERPVGDLLKELRKKRDFWRMWVNKTGGNPYPPGDSRNKENQQSRESKSFRRFTAPVTQIESSRWTDPITYSLAWDENGNLFYPKSRKAQIAALELEIIKETNPDGSLSGLGRLCQAQLNYINSQED